ncbi:TetR/AcrR family transcriptional regulator [Bifidobacterium sp. ESL0800]|uniref:TetR/AcrR family transcriptional regulator n=1 Tax=Bifidobacterium sp. ESL0800 TaxID=2983236 RepID=UPI0023F9792E|nr:TetR/AcrR family transcriptional regulator [Bifidobacterium sp. ESL0800]WEV75181.1 TetR/AcrR family transcriptional regulator [Bifidobacterium sp. ESL0800]
MARNAHPEVTRRRILDAAQKLFAAKGYENTSVQDIIDELGDLSKGAIYHHFKSKLDILEAVSAADNQKALDRYAAVLECKDLNGLQKIRELILSNITDTEHIERLKGTLSTIKDPQEMAESLYTWTCILPNDMRTLIDCGIEDGSIITDYPQEAAELLTLLMNLWFLPNFYPGTRSVLLHRSQCLATICVSLGVPAITRDMTEQFADFYAQIQGPDAEDSTAEAAAEINNANAQTAETKPKGHSD